MTLESLNCVPIEALINGSAASPQSRFVEVAQFDKCVDYKTKAREVGRKFGLLSYQLSRGIDPQKSAEGRCYLLSMEGWRSAEKKKNLFLQHLTTNNMRPK